MTRDPIQEGLAAGWKATDAATLPEDRVVEADVVIVGTGAGGGIAAEILARAGLHVVLVEEGPLKSSRDFHMREAEAYPELYQESAARKTRDKAINILQGRCVGGSTTVNWTSSFRMPPATLAYWRSRFGLEDLTEEALAPWFEAAERRLSVKPWDGLPNENNRLLARGAQALAAETRVMQRNVKGCWNLGYCGMGCPVNAKQSMLVTTLPTALSRGAELYYRARAERLTIAGGHVTELECRAMDARGIHATARRLLIRARHFVLAAGAIGSPALLLRSGAPDPHGLTGRRTFLHPTVISAAVMDHRVAGYSGAPQSLYSDHFLERDPVDGPIGYKLEAPPLHPVLFATTTQGFGAEHARLMRHFADTHVLIALLRDGFHADSPGGTVRLRGDGTPELDYPLTDFVWEGVRRAWLTMAEMQFAAGAREVMPVHELATPYRSWAEARQAIGRLPLQPILARIVSAHVMGGCAMAGDAPRGLVDSFGRHRHLANVSVFDGSVFPTSIGANPQLSIYGLAARNASRLAQELSGRPAPPLA